MRTKKDRKGGIEGRAVQKMDKMGQHGCGQEGFQRAKELLKKIALSPFPMA